MKISINGQTNLIIVGVICITVLEIIALLLGHNGTLLKGVYVLIASAVGISIKTPKFIKNLLR